MKVSEYRASSGLASYMDGKEMVVLFEKLILQRSHLFKKFLPLLLELEKTLLQRTIFVARFICRRRKA